MFEKNRITHIVKRDGKVVQFDQEKITLAIYKAAASVGGHDRKLSEKLSDEVVELLNRNFNGTSLPTVEEIQDLVEKVLIENGHAKTAKAYIIYRYERKKAREEKEKKERDNENIPYRVIWEVLNWNVTHGVDTVEKLNQKIRDGSIRDLIPLAEEFYHSGLDRACEDILSRIHEVRMIIISGPSCSGKTTTTIKLTERLKAKGVRIVPINLDNYFFDLELHPKDEFGDYDFETPEALDLPLINMHLKALIRGETIEVPIYNFKTGLREKQTSPLKLEKDEVLMIDTLHGLYRQMTEGIDEGMKYKIYLETLCQLKDKNGNFVRWTDLRLLRRMVRDSKHRSYDPEKTLKHWHYVRRSEMKHIIPNITSADFILNGSMPYELAVMKHYLFHYFPEFVKTYQNDPKHQDAYIRAKRVYELLDSIEEFKDIDSIPPDSVLREFIGGSIYRY